MALVLLGMGYAVPLVHPAAAQEVLPQTPPELEDFRLDTPPPREDPPLAQPQPQPQPKAETPAPPQRADVVRAAPAPSRNAPAGTPLPAPQNVSPPDPDDPAAETVPDTSAPETDAVPPVQTDSSMPAPSAQESTPWQAWLQYWPFLAALLAALAAFGVLRVFKKRRAENMEVPVIPVARPAPTPARTPAQVPVRTPESTAIPPSLSARFENGDARLSLANLTITGQLHLQYSGAAPLDKVTMRTLVMSASDGQAESIAAFHREAAQGDREILGAMAPGESMTVKIELQVPRGALQAFDWRDRRFVAPIVLVNIASPDPAIVPCRLACVVGQAGSADSPRLLPIPIDRGPKRFEGVQFQPIAA